jgi:hypothetical protein
MKEEEKKLPAVGVGRAEISFLHAVSQHGCATTPPSGAQPLDGRHLRSSEATGHKRNPTIAITGNWWVSASHPSWRGCRILFYKARLYPHTGSDRSGDQVVELSRPLAPCLAYTCACLAQKGIRVLIYRVALTSIASSQLGTPGLASVACRVHRGGPGSMENSSALAEDVASL